MFKEDRKEVFKMVYVHRWNIFSIAQLFTFSIIIAFYHKAFEFSYV